jgi:hypothetical protein
MLLYSNGTPKIPSLGVTPRSSDGNLRLKGLQILARDSEIRQERVLRVKQVPVGSSRI